NVQADHSAIGNQTGIPTFTDQGGNLPFGTNVKLGPLASNGGLTLTQALLAGSQCIDAGSNPAGLSNDQRGLGLARVDGSGADMGAFEIQPGGAPYPACVIGKSVTINNGDAQRSRVTSVRVDFSQVVTLPANTADAFQLQRQGDSVLVGLTAAVSNDS